eukprot:GILJ01018950.1.p1 GENE.GILJ01018950.1~~GILJ01018950.1.p1  ORF type:complete len:545 (-),score=107.40 GILJ01018950.1:258-1658(-)
MISSDVSAGMWSGIQRATYGLIEPNLRPDALYRRLWGTKDKSGAIRIDYEESAEMRKSEPQLLMIPHTKEHAMHQRLKNPTLPKFKEMDNLHFRRVLREAQYHLGHGLRHYMVDGVFGNHAGSGTPYRIFTDSPNHAYVATIAACRKFNYLSAEESSLTKRVGGDPLEELAWRKPGVIIYHCPSYDFEAPRIVEEFGGPRPSDLGLVHQKFIALDPYAIPMKAVMGGILGAEELLKTTAFLCARWGFYADDKKHITLNADSIISKDGKTLTVIIGDASDAVRGSSLLHSTQNIRIGDGFVSRCWDSEVVASKGATLRNRDLVETSTGTVFRPLSGHHGKDAEKTLSNRLLGRRRVGRYGSEHSYTSDVASKAAASGHLLGSSTKPDTEAIVGRSATFRLADTKFIVLGSKGTVAAEAAAKGIVEAFTKKGWLYAEEDKLTAALSDMFGKSKGVSGEDNLSKVVKGE